jgi:hypothetical protein
MNTAAESHAPTVPGPVNFATDPGRYRHWKLSFDGPLASPLPVE